MTVISIGEVFVVSFKLGGSFYVIGSIFSVTILILASTLYRHAITRWIKGKNFDDARMTGIVGEPAYFVVLL